MGLNTSAKSPDVLSKTQVQILRKLAYYSLFSYPLALQDFALESEPELNELVEQGWIAKSGELYALSNNPEDFKRRIEGNELAERAMPKAKKRANFIAQFPFVRGVYISGSLSKGFMTEDGDVDFFVVTKPGRLWLARTMLIAFKKLFLLNSRKFFCMNYFIDTNHLEIEEKNIFTAIELSTLLPICDLGFHQQFANSNTWTEGYIAGSTMGKANQVVKPGGLKKFLEFLLSNWIGSSLDNFFFKLTLNVWEKKFGNFKPKDFELALKSRKYVSKHHPQNFQKKVLEGFEKKITELENLHNIDLSL